MNKFGKRLEILREKKELSYSELEKKTGMSKSLLWRYETGKSDPGLSSLIKLADFFGVTLDWIAGNGDEEVQYTDKDKYDKAINKAIKENITPEKLENIINILKED